MPLAVCATPIGNLDDITLRVLAELRDADVVLAEDTRHTRGLLERHGIRARLLSYHEHNEAARVAELLPRLEAGERMALVTDAGMPLDLRPGRTTRARGARRRCRGDGAARAVGRRDRARRERPRRRQLRVRRLPAAQGGRARRRSGASSAHGHWPVVAFESPQAAARDAALARGVRRRAGGRRLPRADEALRGGRPRACRRGRRAVRRGAEGRDHAGRRRRQRPCPIRPPLGRPWPSSSRPERPGASPPRSSPGSRTRPRTTSTAASL